MMSTVGAASAGPLRPANHQRHPVRGTGRVSQDKPTLNKNQGTRWVSSVSERAPILSGHLPTGERVQIVLPPAAEEPSITIRRPSRVTFSLDELADKGTFAPLSNGDTSAARHRAAVRSRLAGWPIGNQGDDQTSVPAILREIVAHRLNVIVSGATGSGKTTLSKAMIAEIPLDERLIAIEDAKELAFPHANTARLFFSRDGAGVSPVTVKDLLVSCLRMKPDLKAAAARHLRTALA
jgi:type IV secretion system protein VirB11